MKHMKINNLLEISMALSTESDFNKLFAKILNVAMEITNCDSGTLYINDGEVLTFQVMKTLSLAVYQGSKGEKIPLPLIPLSSKNVCARAATEKKRVNLENVYSCEEYELSEIKQYDDANGFKTTTMLVVPMENHYGQVTGVLQLVNALDSNNHIIPFDMKCEDAVKVLASLAAVCITNMNHLTEVKNLFDSFASAISSAIDERTPYNGSHTRNMVRYGKSFLDYMNKRYMEEKGHRFFTENQEEQFIISIWLHDTGKMAISTKIMNKDTRLGDEFAKVEERFGRMLLLSKIQFLEKEITKEQYEEQLKSIEAGIELIRHANVDSNLPAHMEEGIMELGSKLYTDEMGQQKPWITPKELKMLQIQKGTLTDEERLIMEHHVVITKSLLKRINFTSNYNHVVEWAANHHEFVDGSGYPNHLKGQELSVEVRLLTILDIFDALTATDRPYKDPVSVTKALNILENMVSEGKLDGQLVEFFMESEAWVVPEPCLVE